MTSISEIREDMEVVGSDDQHVGTVDRIENDNIKLNKKDSPNGVHHLIPVRWVDAVESNIVRLTKTAAEVMAEWSEAGNGEMRAGRGA